MDEQGNRVRYYSLKSKEDFLECEADTPPEPFDLQSKIRQAYVWLGLLIAFLLLILISVQVTLLTINARRLPLSYIPLVQPQPCGTTADDARTKGCVFAPGLAAWVPPSCYDAELEEEFITKYSSVNWYYGEGREPDLTRRIPSIEALSNVTNYAFTTWGYHKAHCTHTWKLSHRAIENGWMVRGKIRDYHHPVHCEKILLDTSVPDEKVWTAVSIDFPECVTYSSICTGAH